jgi:hypothetical protein
VASSSTEPLDASDHFIPVHGIAELVRRDKQIPVQIISGRIRNYKAVTITMRHQMALEQMRITRGGSASRFGHRSTGRFWPGVTELRAAADKPVSSAAHLFDQPLPFESRNDRAQSAPTRMTQV